MGEPKAVPAVRDRRRWYDPFIIGVGVLCIICVAVTVLVASTVLDTKTKVDESLCGQLRSFNISQNRERQLAKSDAPATRPAHRQSVRAYERVIADIEPLVKCPKRSRSAP